MSKKNIGSTIGVLAAVTIGASAYASTINNLDKEDQSKKVLENKNIKITRIATGIPIGTDIDYIDAMTLEFALEGRKDI